MLANPGGLPGALFGTKAFMIVDTTVKMELAPKYVVLELPPASLMKWLPFTAKCNEISSI